MMAHKKTDPFAVLAEVSRILAGSLGYEATLAAVARLALPYLGSWCALDVCEEGGTMRRLAIIHPDPEKQTLARVLESGWPPERDDPFGVPAVMRTGSTVVIAHVDDALLVRAARTPEVLRVLRALGIGSLITVPLIARERMLGAMTFVSATTGHQYDESDVTLAEHLAALSALAVDNARLHRAGVERAETEATTRAKSAFLATMSHELRTPINAIIGYVELLELGLAGSVTAKQREYLSRIRLSGTHLVRLVTDVLELSRGEAGQLPVAGEPLRTAAAVAGALSLTFPAAHAKGVSLVDAHAHEPGGACDVSYVGDEHRVRQVLVNLLINAVNFTPRGGTIVLSCGVVEDAPAQASLAGGGPWAFIRVADSGEGVMPSKQAAVFEPFTQGESGFKRTQGGTGLGLTISRQLARLMGGDVTLVSPPGEGATFTLWLPAAESSVGVTEEPLNEGAAGENKAAGEGADTRLARAFRANAGYRAYALSEIGTHLRRHVEGVLESVAARLRADPEFPQAATLHQAELEDHLFAFLANLVQSLVAIDETGGVESAVYRDGNEIQRVISALHGRIRHAQGWTIEQVEREVAIVDEEIEGVIHRRVPSAAGDVTAALDVIRHLLRESREASAQAYRQAADVATRAGRIK